MEIGIYFISFVLFYALLKKVGKINYAIAICMTILYAIAYPLNSMLAGFHYLSFGLVEIMAIVYIMENRKHIDKKVQWLLLSSLNFGLIFSYCLFCPFVYLGEFVTIYLEAKKENKKDFFLFIIVTLFLPGIIGITYLVIPKMFSEVTVGEALKIEGWIYENKWSNFLFFIPFVSCHFYQKKKEKNMEFAEILTIFLVVYMLVLLLAKQFGICSNYYFTKNYYALWFLGALLTARYLLHLKNKYFPIVYLTVYTVLLILSLCFQVSDISKKEENLSTLMDIYCFNKTVLASLDCHLNSGELELLIQWEKEIQKEEGNSMFIMENYQKDWIESLTGRKEVTQNPKYFILMKTNKIYIQVDTVLKNSSIPLFYENEAGKIYKREEAKK